ncbi:hypothetical protein AB0G15_04785 [Streptosporangium sp. NPDC023825]|uniref:hypothetical protein n=1 Tax=Streptosporangium sp. NPDC023825 TaxID=3154909 RepID=UPI003447B9B6
MPRSPGATTRSSLSRCSPWQLLVFVVGLFLVVPTLSRYGLASAITSWASLATLLWFEWCRRREARVPMLTFVVAGTAPVAVGDDAVAHGLNRTRIMRTS